MEFPDGLGHQDTYPLCDQDSFSLWLSLAYLRT